MYQSMNRKSIFSYIMAGIATFGMMSCLDFDDPVDTMSFGQMALEDSVCRGQPDEIN